MKIDDLPRKVQDFCLNHSLYEPGERVGLAVSGGRDSMVMLELFRRFEAPRPELVVLHFNHRLRGRESDQDEAAVARVCKEAGLPFLSDHGDVSAYAQTARLSLETAARTLRYEFFERAARQAKLQRIATAHTADDQAETVLDHLLRGAGISGLRGIPMQRGIFIRPLLFIRRSELAAFAAVHGIGFREDASNYDRRFRRNRIRLDLLPVLEQYNPRIVEALCRTACSAEDAECVLQHTAEEALTNCLVEQEKEKIVLDIQAFLAYFNSLQRLILQRVLEQMGEDPRTLSFSVWENFSRFLTKSYSGRSYSLTRSLELSASQGLLTIERRRPLPQPVSFDRLEGVIPLWDDYLLEISPTAPPLTPAPKSAMEEYIDADAALPPYRVRTVQPGDVLVPINGRGRRKVSDLLIDAKIPLAERRRLPILECRTGIVWVCGVRSADPYKITETTQKIIKLTLRKHGGQIDL